MRKKHWRILLWLMIGLPLIAVAKEKDPGFISFSYIWVAFASIHWTAGVFSPIAKMKVKDETEKKETIKIISILFVIRAIIILLIIPSFPEIFMVDFFALFALTFIIGIISAIKGGKNMATSNDTINVVSVPTGTITCPKCGRVMAYGNTRCVVCGENLQNVSYECAKCKAINAPTAKFCKNCGTAMTQTMITASSLLSPAKCPTCSMELVEGAKFCRQCGENVESIMAERAKVPQIPRASAGTKVDISSYESYLVNGSETSAILSIVQKELNATPDNKGKTLPKIEKRKLLFTIIYSIISFLLVSIYVFYHTHLSLLLTIWIVATIIYRMISKKYNLERYIEQQVERRPDEKISYIVSSVLQGATRSKGAYTLARILSIALVFVGLIVCYNKPHMIYERQSDGYALRYYTYGIIYADTEVEIPAKYKGEPVVGIRGDTFRNVTTIRKVTLPDTIVEIRGGAFAGCTSLEEINLPKLITEIHGSTFEDCYELKSIDIPEGVTRIGGSAFRNCSSLEEAHIPKSVKEIGSSAFRSTRLSSVCISKNAEVNERAFKESNVSIGYYEEDCVPSTNSYYGDYNSYDYGY